MTILTVIYHETQSHYNMALKTWASIPEGVNSVSVANKCLPDMQYPEYIENDENCLSRAWNKGLKKIFETEEVAFVSGLDSVCPPLEDLEYMQNTLLENPQWGMLSATAVGIGAKPITNPKDYEMQHGDGSFSFFAITRECFTTVGGFDERFKPAYFEDNDYLERLWGAGYRPKRTERVTFKHMVQGTVKFGTESRETYPVFMQKNLELFKSIYGFVPPHLPPNVRFN